MVLRMSCQFVSYYLGNGAQGCRLFELVVAECTRLTGCVLVGLGLLQPQTSSCSSSPARMCVHVTWLGSRDCPQQNLPSIGPQACCPQNRPIINKIAALPITPFSQTRTTRHLLTRFIEKSVGLGLAERV